MANNISIIGRLAADSELKNVAGTALLEFRIADDVGFGDKKVTNWWRCALWGKQAEGKLIDFLKKGQQVVVFGEATMRPWEDKQGAKQISPELRVSSVQLAGGAGKQDGGASGQSSGGSSAPSGGAKKAAPDDDSDIPF